MILLINFLKNFLVNVWLSKMGATLYFFLLFFIFNNIDAVGQMPIRIANEKYLLSQNTEGIDVPILKKHLDRFQIFVKHDVGISILSVDEKKERNDSTYFKVIVKDRVEDYLWTRDKLLFVTAKGLAYATVNQDTLTYFAYKNRKARYSTIEGLNERTALAFELYPFHPFSAEDKLHLYIVDTENPKVIFEKHLDFDGVSLSNIVQRWVSYSNKEVFVVSPFKGLVDVYDFSLNKIDSIPLEINGIGIPSTIHFAKRQDAIKKQTDSVLLSLKEKYGSDSSFNFVSSYYSKDELTKRMDSLRRHHSYIERIFHFNDSIQLLSIFRPEYGDEFRDVYVLNVNTKVLTDSIIRWRSKAASDIVFETPSQYFMVDLKVNYPSSPIFHNGMVHILTDISSKWFQSGTKKEINEHIFRVKNKYKTKQWFLRSYSLEGLSY